VRTFIPRADPVAVYDDRSGVDLSSVAALAGAAAVAVGCWLRWLRVRPGYDGPVPMVLLPGMERGFAGVDPVLVGAALAGVAAAALPAAARALVRVGAGGLVLALVARWAVGTAMWGPYGPAPGLSLTVLGGLALVAAGLAEGWRRRRGDDPP